MNMMNNSNNNNTSPLTMTTILSLSTLTIVQMFTPADPLGRVRSIHTHCILHVKYITYTVYLQLSCRTSLFLDYEISTTASWTGEKRYTQCILLE